MSKQINTGGEYIRVVFSIENAGFRSISVQDAMKIYLGCLYSMTEHFLPDNELPPPIENFSTNNALFHEYLSEWCRKQPEPIILSIDEINSVWDDVLISTSRQLRDGFQIRPGSFPASVALVCSGDIRDYKMKIREQDGALGNSSYFNIKSKSFRK